MSSLDKIAKNLLLRGRSNFRHLISEFPDRYNHLLGKGHFPYEFLDKISKLDYSGCPPHKNFFSRLNNTNITEQEYHQVQTIYQIFHLESLRDLLELYVKQDVLILADCMEFYREMVDTNYNLEALAYYSSPALSFDAALKMTSVQLELLPSATMYNFFAAGVRGGIAMATRHYFKANNKYLPDYDKEKVSSFGFYADVTNLYGYCLSQQLPHSGFEWVSLSVDEVLKIIKSYDHSQDSVGYVLEVSLEIPNRLHDHFYDYPPIPDHCVINLDMLSPWTRLLMGEGHFKADRKLTPTLFDKNNYVTHITNLKLFINLGVILKEVHNVVKFYQSAWLNEYIEFNSQKRANAASTVEKDFFKLQINSVFGKMLQNERRYRKFSVCRTRSKLKRCLSKSTLKDVHCFGDNLFLLEFKKLSITLSKPIFVGMTCLELAKYFMVDYHYNIMVPFFGRLNIEIMYTDTDSFIWRVLTDDLYSDLVKLRGDFDFSKYPFNHPLHNTVNSCVRGKWKDELNGNILLEAIFLRAKSYSILTSNDKISAMAGVKKCMQKLIVHDNFRDILFESGRLFIKQKRFSSSNMTISTVTNERLALSPIDLKRYQMNKELTLPYGHHMLKLKNFI